MNNAIILDTINETLDGINTLCMIRDAYFSEDFGYSAEETVKAMDFITRKMVDILLDLKNQTQAEAEEARKKIDPDIVFSKRDKITKVEKNDMDPQRKQTEEPLEAVYR